MFSKSICYIIIDYMALVIKRICKKTAAVVNHKFSIPFLLATNYLFTFWNIFKPTLIVSLLVLLLDVFFLCFFENKKGLVLLFALYPLARVLKMPSISTSFVTLLLPVFYVRLFFACLKNHFSGISKNKLFLLLLFALYCLFVLVTSLINYQGFTILQLASYFVYLAFPVFCVVAFKTKDDVAGVANLIVAATSFLVGILLTLMFYYVIPNGESLLEGAGVNAFSMGAYGIRFAPLTDDPNYGTALILLLASLFICAKKTRREMCVGYPIMALDLLLSIFSLSKMYFICLMAVLIFILLKTVVSFKSVPLTICGAIGLVSLSFIVLGSSFGQTLLLRAIGTTDGVDLNRITSGRTELFGEYSSYIMSHPLVLVFGKGPLFADSSVFSGGEHNTFTKTIFGSGLVGVSLMLLVFFLMLKERFDGLRRFPRDPMFYSFMLCLIICCMALCLTPATVLPIVIVAAQFIPIGSKWKIKTIEPTAITI